MVLLTLILVAPTAVLLFLLLFEANLFRKVDPWSIEVVASVLVGENMPLEIIEP